MLIELWSLSIKRTNFLYSSLTKPFTSELKILFIIIEVSRIKVFDFFAMY